MREFDESWGLFPLCKRGIKGDLNLFQWGSISELVPDNPVLTSDSLQKTNGMKSKKPVIGWS